MVGGAVAPPAASAVIRAGLLGNWQFYRDGCRGETMYTVVPNVLGYLEKEKRVLLGLREDHPLKIYRNHWDLPGGRIEPGEIVVEALRREFLEETGLTIVKAHLVEAYHNSNPDEGAPGLCLLYRIEEVEGEIRVSSDLQALEYVKKSGIGRLQLPPWSKYFLREYL